MRSMENVIAGVEVALDKMHKDDPIPVTTLYAAMMILAERARVQHETDYQEALARVRGEQ